LQGGFKKRKGRDQYRSLSKRIRLIPFPRRESYLPIKSKQLVAIKSKQTRHRTSFNDIDVINPPETRWLGARHSGGGYTVTGHPRKHYPRVLHGHRHPNNSATTTRTRSNKRTRSPHPNRRTIDKVDDTPYLREERHIDSGPHYLFIFETHSLSLSLSR
jgi:hypothetical protein